MSAPSHPASIQVIREQRRKKIEFEYDIAVGLFMAEIGRLCGFKAKVAPLSVFVALRKEFRNSIITCALDHLEEQDNG